MDEFLEQSRTEANDPRSDRELLLSIDRRLEYLERRERQSRIRNIIILAVVVVILAVLACILVPKIFGFVNRITALEAKTEQIIEDIESLNLERLSGTVDVLSGIDFSGLSEAVNKLQGMLEPILNLFGK